MSHTSPRAWLSALEDKGSLRPVSKAVDPPFGSTAPEHKADGRRKRDSNNATVA